MCYIEGREDGAWYACDWQADSPAIVKSQYASLASDIKGCPLLRGNITELQLPELGLWLEDLRDYHGLRINLSGERSDNPMVSISYFVTH
jgi:hypothetical protein